MAETEIGCSAIPAAIGGGVPEQDFLLILGLYGNGKLDLDALIGKTIPLEGINDAFRELDAGIDTRTVITFA